MSLKDILYDNEMPTSVKNNRLAETVDGFRHGTSYSPKRMIDNAIKIHESLMDSSEMKNA